MAIGWPHAPFVVPEHVYAGWDAREAGKKAERRWNRLFKSYKVSFPEAAEFERRVALDDARVQALTSEFNGRAETLATRKASQNVLDTLVARCRNFSAVRPTLPAPI